jgi:hypothetical protein
MTGGGTIWYTLMARSAYWRRFPDSREVHKPLVLEAKRVGKQH